jgi:AcrR family transcriptional regulator
MTDTAASPFVTAKPTATAGPAGEATAGMASEATARAAGAATAGHTAPATAPPSGEAGGQNRGTARPAGAAAAGQTAPAPAPPAGEAGGQTRRGTARQDRETARQQDRDGARQDRETARQDRDAARQAEAPERTDGRSRRGTRARIQSVAVEMFTEHGYEKTSLREIAEALGVTKAALYYHFKSKEDIIRSLVEDYFGRIDALVSWAETEPAGAARRAEILRRYVAIVEEGEAAFRMLHQNQAAIQSLSGSKNTGQLFRERLSPLIRLLTGPDPGLEDRLRAAMALGGISMGWMVFSEEEPDRSRLSAAVLQVATEIAG